MAKVDCKAFDCVYNCLSCCLKSSIKVSSLDEACLSYHKSKKDINQKIMYDEEMGNLESSNRYVCINCDKLECIYNNDRLCNSKEVEIGSVKSSRISEGKCETFKV